MLGLRWTIGDVNPRGFASLRLSIWGAWRLFGASARYVVHVNTVTIDEARERTGVVPDAIEWEAVDSAIPACLANHLDPAMVQGAAWKLLPVRAFPCDHELALDNDVILWRVPKAIVDWLYGRAQLVLAEDVRQSFGRFSELCPDRALNTSVRGLPPGFSLDGAFRDVLARHPGRLSSEVDVQGLQVAALSGPGKLAVVALDEVTLCSPFPPHRPHLGEAGAHFVGLTGRLGVELEGRSAEEVRAEHWDGHVAEVARRVGATR